MNKQIQELHDSYKSPEAKKVVEYMWDIADTQAFPVERLVPIIKDVADDSEYLAFRSTTEEDDIGIGPNSVGEYLVGPDKLDKEDGE